MGWITGCTQPQWWSWVEGPEFPVLCLPSGHRFSIQLLQRQYCWDGMRYPCRKGGFQGGKGSCKRARCCGASGAHVLARQTSQLRFPFSFSYQRRYPDRLKNYTSQCQRTNSWCTQAERRDAPKAQLSKSKRALQ